MDGERTSALENLSFSNEKLIKLTQKNSKKKEKKRTNSYNMTVLGYDFSVADSFGIRLAGRLKSF